MASLGDASMSPELISMVVSASGKDYNEGSSYQLEFKGPGVKITEYDEHGVLVDTTTYVPTEQITFDWSDEQRVIDDIKEKNKLKETIFRIFITVIIFSCIFAYAVLLYYR